MDLEADTLPMLRNVGLLYDIKADYFTFKVSAEAEPFTWRVVLSTISNLYDPIGFALPVTTQSKSILRDLIAENGDWNSPLPQEIEETLVLWRESLKQLFSLSITRPYTNLSPSAAAQRELCIFSDASIIAKNCHCCSCYLKVKDADVNYYVGIVTDKAKLFHVLSKKFQD